VPYMSGLNPDRMQGAAFTFNAQSFTDFVLSLKTEPLAPSISFPTFSHALKDPTPSTEPLNGHHRIVIIEGLYTFLDVEPWRRAAEVLDLRVFIDVDPRTARERLVRRCLAEGIEDTMEKAVERGECFCI
jgi:pantothenate kinase